MLPACLKGDLFLVDELLTVFLLFHLQAQKLLVLSVGSSLILPNVVLVLFHGSCIREHLVVHLHVFHFNFAQLGSQPVQGLFLN